MTDLGALSDDGDGSKTPELDGNASLVDAISSNDATNEVVGDGGVIDDGAADDGALDDGAPDPCPHGRGPRMAKVATQILVPFCIDKTEVTQAQYAAFLAANVDPASQVTACQWNATFQPGLVNSFMPDTQPNKPVVAVDYCDAVTFCQWSGKRLCGAVAGAGNDAGELKQSELLNPKYDQWYAVCAGSALLNYPYGNTFDPTACNGRDGGTSPVADVGSFAKCESKTFPGVLDLSGNVDEWFASAPPDNRDAGDPSTEHAARGGNVQSDDTGLGCALPGGGFFHPPQSSQSYYLGFRCCADLAAEE